MKILYLTARFPYPPHRGDRHAAYHHLRSMSRSHRVTLLSFTDGHEPPEAAEHVGQLCERVETVALPRARSWAQAWLGLASPVPSQVSYYASNAMRRKVGALCSETQFDAIFVQLFRMAPYVAHLAHPAKVLFLTDSIALSLERSRRFQPWWKQLPIEWERRRVAVFEVEMARAFRECWVLSEVDRRHLEARGCSNIAVVPHGVDEQLFELPLGGREGNRVMFLGNLSVPHNMDAAAFLAREIWPRIRVAIPQAELELAGADPHPAVRALARLPGVSVPGLVSDLSALWSRSAVMLAPLRFSAGIQNKVLEAMAAGVPAVTTPQVAEALGARNGDVLRVGVDAESLAGAVIEVLRDRVTTASMIRRARDFVRERYTWDSLVTRLERVAGESKGEP